MFGELINKKAKGSSVMGSKSVHGKLFHEKADTKHYVPVAQLD